MQVNITTISDIDNIIANKFFIGNKELLKISLAYQELFTFKNEEKIQAIAMFHEFFPNCFRCGVVLSEDISPYSLRFFKKWMKQKIKEKNCKRLETEGFSNKTLVRFHNFLGFKKEVSINEEYIKWVIQ